jgi:hypothetical protein
MRPATRRSSSQRRKRGRSTARSAVETTRRVAPSSSVILLSLSSRSVPSCYHRLINALWPLKRVPLS